MVQSCSPQETKFLAKLAAKRITYGRLAQLGERLPYKQDVIGSSPIVSTQRADHLIGSFL